MNITKKTVLLSCLFLLNSVVSMAQTGRQDARTLDTKIADLLNRFPSQNASAHEGLMEQMGGLGQEGLLQMALMLSPTANNENLAYALAGFASYASHPSKHDYARIAIQAYGKALDRLDYPEGKDFLLTQLKWMGKEDAAPFVEPLLHDPYHSAKASQVLESIGSSSSEQALLLALRTSTDEAQKVNFIQALGGIGSGLALADLNPYAASTNQDLKKVSLYALGEIADPKSAKVLARAAKSADWGYEPTNATATYLRYVSRLADKGYSKTALKLAKGLHKSAAKAGQPHTQGGALALLAMLEPSKAPKLLAAAVLSNNAQYRGIALSQVLKSGLSTDMAFWRQLLSGASPDAQVAIIGALGRVRGAETVALIKPFLGVDNPSVRAAAIDAAVLAGGDLVLDDLLAQVNQADEPTLIRIQEALKTMPGTRVTPEIAKAIPNANAPAKVVLIEVLSARSAEDHMEVVLNEVRDSDPAVKNAAFRSLSSLANAGHADQLLGLLRSYQDARQLDWIQQALVSSVTRMNNQREQTSWVVQSLRGLDESKQLYLYEVLGQTGGDAAMTQLGFIYRDGGAAQKLAVIRALNNSKDSQAPTMLLEIARAASGELKEEALVGFVRLIPNQSWSPENKVIHLRNALELTGADQTKSQAIRALGQYPTFQSLVTVGNFLDTPAQQQDAARAVMNIVGQTDSFYGELVRKLVEKTRDVISGQDSQYYKTSLQKFLDEMPSGVGYYPLFNGVDLEGWQGVFSNPIKRFQLDKRTYDREQAKANEQMRQGWEAKDGLLVFKGKGENIGTIKHYGDFEMLVDWKITPDGDAGIYLRGTPQVQIWDIARTNVGAEVGSGGLYNNTKHESKPKKVADNPVGEWNTFYIKMVGENVTVLLNGELVVDNVTLENYWDRTQSLFPKEMIELQAHGTYVAYRDLYIRELDGSEPFVLSEEEASAGFEVLFDGTNLDKWTGNKTDYVVENGYIAIYPDRGGSGNLFTEREYGDFEFRFEFKLTPGANNGLGIRAPLTGDAAYQGMELQILDNTADIYRNLKDYQFHGSLYGIAAAKKGALKLVGEWNYQEVVVKGNKIQVTLNGTVILDVDISDAKENGTIDGREHPGLFRERGHIGFLGHGDVVYFRNIRVLDLE
ncbi:hypothetical protein ADIS_0581 [Lunatimonas lonarensis]|uniref:3-keto-alpha-glucoside-1,2-lyase/3-keto-2-hydroxy-glucal hydratase domain-containing protein n=1 Tax=Lunatimonas lonarensis TaxID=1232681 RepID=R7ZY75_9BACT|nr:DUF1080 domain-containing protein [Lunatimonas lonarensis]EON78988.1 hypothetical protein ADIS_0581 [Lunatimonas lonarensis]